MVSRAQMQALVMKTQTKEMERMVADFLIVAWEAVSIPLDITPQDNIIITNRSMAKCMVM